LKGKSERVAAFRLVSVDPAAEGFARHLDVPLVGRERELDILRQAWDRTVQESRCHLLTLLGDAGVGKSRLVGELLSGVADQATVLRGRCLHYGDGITFWPLVEALMPVGVAAQHVLEHLNSGGAATPQELYWEVRRLLESLAAERPVVLYLDDLQWAEPMLLDLIDHVADLSRGAAILLLCTARPELLEDRPGWGGGKLTATTVLLEPLVVEESEALLDALGDGLDRDARMRVIEASEGNPLFLEEMVALARERGTVEVPPTIQALLAARLERLGSEERELLERGAVEGEVFHRLAVKALAGERLAAEIELRLAGLVRKELIRPHPATLSGDEAFRFRHLLIRDAAYDSLPKATRAELHERFARWLEEQAAELLELDEIAGWHYEQAVRYQQELGRASDPVLAASAAAHLQAAGRRANARNDVQAAVNLLKRAMALTPEGDSRRAEIAVDLAEQLGDAGEFTAAIELLGEAQRDPLSGPLARLTSLELRLQTDPGAALPQIDEVLPEELERLQQAGRPRELAKAHMLAFFRFLIASQAALASQQVRLAADYAAMAGDDGLRARALGWYMTMLVFGPADDRAIEREVDEIEQGEPGPYLVAFIDQGRSEVCRLRGEVDDAMRLMYRSMSTLEGLGMRTMAAASAQLAAQIAISAGAYEDAVALLLRSDATLAEFGERSYRSTIQAYLAWLYSMIPQPDAALAACELCEELTAPEDVINFAMTPRTRSQVARGDGNLKLAEEQAQLAVHHAFRTDNPVLQGAARLELARVLQALGRGGEAVAEARAALEVYEAKGDRPGMKWAQTLLDEL
jgi:tetratricopeptide (TPR) repeat protein